MGECVEIYLCIDSVYCLQYSYICSADMTAHLAAFYT